MKEETGVVISFSRFTGYGFIKPDDGGREVLFHYSAIVSDGYRNLYEDDKVTYKLIDNGKEPEAQTVRRLNDPEQLRLQYMVTAAAAGHELGSWEALLGDIYVGYQATCSKCKMSVSVWESGTAYSFLNDTCEDSAEYRKDIQEQTMLFDGRAHKAFFNDITENGYHIFSRQHARIDGFYPNEFPNYPNIDISEVRIDDSITIRAFFPKDRRSKSSVDSGLIDLEVELVDVSAKTIMGNIITELPSSFALSKNTSIELSIDEVLELNNR